MKTIKTLILFVFIPLLSFSQSNAELSATIDSYLNEKFSASEPGGVVLVAKGDEIIFRKAYGLANEKLKQANTPETIFRIGSITKQFTSTAILKLVAEKKISLDDPITKFLPDYPMGDHAITIQHLLTHTSGIKSYTSLQEVVGSKESKERAYTVNEVINTFKSKPMDFAPGSSQLYNNSGFFLLGAIIEKVSGKTWGKYVEENLFTPLGMKSSFTNDIGISGESTGYYKRKNGYDVANIVHPSVSYSAGAIASTVDDLYKWDKAVFAGKIVSLDLMQKAWTPVKLSDGTTRPYGFGWQFGEVGNLKVIGHGGTIDGFQSYAWFVPNVKIFVVVLSNNMGSTPLEYASKILELVNGH